MDCNRILILKVSLHLAFDPSLHITKLSQAALFCDSVAFFSGLKTSLRSDLINYVEISSVQLLISICVYT